MCWHKMDWNKTDELKDHCFYLVTHKDYKTPMKAKWHSDAGGIWEIRGCPVVYTGIDDDVTAFTSRYEFAWDDDHLVLAWMEMPELYKEE